MYMSLTVKNLYFINNGGEKMKRTLLDDFMKIYKNIECDSLDCYCSECSNKYICDLIDEIIVSISKFY